MQRVDLGRFGVNAGTGMGCTVPCRRVYRIIPVAGDPYERGNPLVPGDSCDRRASDTWVFRDPP